MTTPRPPRREPPRRRWYDAIFAIRTRLLLVHAFLVVVPLAGLEFARTYERELLRGEEEGMVALSTALAAAVRTELAEGRSLDAPAAAAAARAAARSLKAQIRILDTDGNAIVDTGPEYVELVTRGRRLLSPIDFRTEPRPPLVIGDPPPPGQTFAARPEVAKALGGSAARYTRVPAELRGVMLYVAEPITSGGKVAGAVYVTRTTYPVMVSLYRVRNGLERVALGSLAVALVVALYLAFTISRPLGKLTDAARRIAAGERGVALKLSGRDEVADLARNFDHMARELDARLAYISELAANVSHEFKTPIASIRGAAELLREGAADDPAARVRFLDNILGDTERLSRLVTRLLELSRIESDAEPARPLDYRALVEEVVERHRAAGHAVTLEYAARASHLLGRGDHLESVLSNLLDNASRFSAAGAPITVRVHAPDPSTLVTEVTDRGRGISPENLSQVWDRFFTTARDEGGTGLGLSIVRAIVETHGGSVSARSEPGAGSTFSFTLPRRL